MKARQVGGRQTIMNFVAGALVVVCLTVGVCLLLQSTIRPDGQTGGPIDGLPSHLRAFDFDGHRCVYSRHKGYGLQCWEIEGDSLGE